jgi:histidyl-tRNA synthetase
MSSYEIILNNRRLLDGIINAAGIGEDKKGAALRGLDKTAKIGEGRVIKEFKENGINEENYRSFMELIKFDKDLADMEKLSILSKRLNKSVKDELVKNQAIEGAKELLSILENAGAVGLDFIKYDPLLVRGLDYYTGPIFEIKSKDLSIGSFAAGGRYDNLVELYGARQEGACGISFGVERIIDIIKERDEEALKSLPSPVKLYIVYLSENERLYAYKAAKTLRLKGISVELSVSVSPNISKEIKYADKKKIEYVAIIGEKEADEKKLTVKNIKTREEKLITLEKLIKLLNNNYI